MDGIEAVKAYKPYNEQEQQDKDIALKCLEAFGDILTRDNKVAHLTGSGFVVNRKRDKMLMVHHNIFNAWSWTGGHADGEKDLLLVAVKEAGEETGVKKIRPVSEEIISLDIIPVLGHKRRGKYISPHLHISVAYLLEADEHEPLVSKPDENSDVRWIPIDEIAEYSNEPHMIDIYTKIISKLEEFFS